MPFLIILLLAIFPFGKVLPVNDFVVAGVVGVFFLTHRRWPKTPLIRPILFFLGAALFSLLFNIRNFSLAQLGTAALYPLRWAVYAGLYFVFREADKNIVRRWLLITISIIAVFGLAQFIFVPDLRFLHFFGWDDHYFRLVSTFLDPGFTGAILVLGLVLAYFYQPAFVFLFFPALLLTYSRASYLMFLISFAAVAWYKRSFKIIMMAVLALLIALPLLPKSAGEGTNLERTTSADARLVNWQQAISVWKTSPVFGVGFDTYRYTTGASAQSHAGAGVDSSLLLVLATTGIVGEAAYLFLLWSMWQAGSNSLLFRVALLGVVIHSFFDNTLFYPAVMEIVWILLALGSSGFRPDRRQ
ncbi:MAG: O-antigen ligase family protein [Patescibacteria group bacterium]|nr:O-antigen ligase family protein [Patescibacteria group bacterium]MCL5431756.1 O-antigen ligase family protein [Patescibacteria group bacterium]